MRRTRLQVGLPQLRLHDLRHTGNTLAAATGASTKELMVRMSHASPRAALTQPALGHALVTAASAPAAKPASQAPDQGATVHA